MTKIIVNPTQVRDHQSPAPCISLRSGRGGDLPGRDGHPVQVDSAVGAQQNDQLQLRRDHVRHRCLTLRHGGTLRGKLAKEYRLSHLFVDLGWVDFDLGVPLSCPGAQPLLLHTHQPRQNWADSGTLRIQVRRHPVLFFVFFLGHRFRSFSFSKPKIN